MVRHFHVRHFQRPHILLHVNVRNDDVVTEQKSNNLSQLDMEMPFGTVMRL